MSKELDAWEDLKENYYRRNVVVHNQSQVSELYNEKLGKNERIDSKLRNNPNYIRTMRNNLDKYIDFIYDKNYYKIGHELRSFCEAIVGVVSPTFCINKNSKILQFYILILCIKYYGI